MKDEKQRSDHFKEPNQISDCERLIWISGSLKGFYIDFQHQTVGYRDCPAERLEYRKILTLRFLFVHSDTYVTSPMIQMTESLNSVDLPKTISAIKKAFLTVLSQIFETHNENEMPENSAEALFDRIIDRHKVNGYMGYRLLTENTILLTKEAPDFFIPEETKASCKEASKEDSISPSEITGTSPSDVHQPSASHYFTGFSISSYFRKNWLPLFLILNIGILTYLVFDAAHISLTALMYEAVIRPYPLSAMVLLLLSALPAAAGYFIDRSRALKKYQQLHPDADLSMLSPEDERRIVMNVAGYFDPSARHMTFFLLSNVTGALSTVSLINFVRNIDGVSEYIQRTVPGFVFPLILFFSIAIAFFTNYSLCSTPSTERNPENYLLSRAHSFLNTLYLIIILAVSCGLIYVFFSYRFGHTGAFHLDVSFSIALLTFFLYLWFTSCSPMADTIDSVAKRNFASGVPIFTSVSLIFTLLCFDGSFSCILAILTILICDLIWLIYIKKRKARSLRAFSLSFFNGMAGCIILLLIIDLFS